MKHRGYHESLAPRVHFRYLLPGSQNMGVSKQLLIWDKEIAPEGRIKNC